jgi:hypothetical protein
MRLKRVHLGSEPSRQGHIYKQQHNHPKRRDQRTAKEWAMASWQETK